MSFGWKELSPSDRYQVYQQKPLSDLELNVLQMLYQPVLGREAVSLFEFLNNNHKEGQEAYLSYLFSLMQMGIQDFYQARVKLEGIGLLKTFKKEADYIFLVFPPLSPQVFFSNEIMNSLLLQNVGEQNYHVLVTFFQKKCPDVSNYQDISRSFLDAFHYRPQAQDLQHKAPSVPLKDEPSPLTIKISESDSTFDWPLFLESMQSNFVKQSSLKDDKVKESILFFHECYGINEVDMQKLVLMSSHSDSGELSLKDLAKNVRYHYQPLTDQTNISQVVDGSKEERKVSQKLDLSDQEKVLIEASQANSPMAFISSIKEQKGGYVTQDERFVIEEIVKKSGLKSEVINILIHYILVVKKNDTVNKNFANQIANNWAQAKVDSAESAIQQVRNFKDQALDKRQQSKEKISSRPLIRREELPDWAKDNQAKDLQDQPLSSDLQKDFGSRLNQLRSRWANKEGN